MHILSHTFVSPLPVQHGWARQEKKRKRADKEDKKAPDQAWENFRLQPLPPNRPMSKPPLFRRRRQTRNGAKRLIHF